MNSTADNKWINDVETKIRSFAQTYSTVYVKTERQISAYFEIGCLFALINFYKRKRFSCTPMNIAADGSFRYLTTPNGNPDNFSYFLVKKHKMEFEIRQQVRILSHVGKDISFTPDIVVIRNKASIRNEHDKDYAGGHRRFFFVPSDAVVAAHECKSMSPFPELLVSFIGMLIVGHRWMDTEGFRNIISPTGEHLAPTLFVGGCPRSIHRRMIEGLKNTYPMNIVVGMHSGSWNLLSKTVKINCIGTPEEYPPPAAGAQRVHRPENAQDPFDPLL